MSINKFFQKRGATYGQPIGILIMDELFLRIPGDVGNATSYPFPVIYEVIRGFSGPDIVSKEVNPALKSSLCKAAKELEEKGVKAIVGGCGFFGRFQKELTESVNIPVFSSSLLFVPMISKSLPKTKKRVGILFADASQVSDEFLRAVGIDESIPIAIAGFDWVDDSEMDWNESDPIKMQQSLDGVLVKLARILISKTPDVGTLVFECTNMPPAAHAVQEETGLPIFDVTTLVKLAHDTVIRKRFNGYM